ncbi:MAG: ABC transporter ATP-binding protein [Micrococcales bacterium]|nr:ABC transporter ATP-binding protein [Micrococcales bacterium]OJX66698.1 MAG: ABC transporter ATP-binding protein [Micrococcales bacterium 72-143]
MNARIATTGGQTGPVLEVTDLSLRRVGSTNPASLVQSVSFEVGAGECVALIGESGCGKTLTSMAVLGLLPKAIRVESGSVRLEGTEILGSSEREYARYRGNSVGAIFQDPMSSLDPTMKIGDQIAESRRIHLGESRTEGRRRAVELLERVGIANARSRLDSYPFELSGGMQQRVMIAAAIACEPAVLIADEPTTALDVTVQAGVLDLLRGLQTELGLAVLLVTHDLGVVADFSDRVAVMYAGQIVERGATRELLDELPMHPYTKALAASVAQTGRAHTVLPTIPGRVPSADEMPMGCRFQKRCPFAEPDRCGRPQEEVRLGPGRAARCVRVHEINDVEVLNRG